MKFYEKLRQELSLCHKHKFSNSYILATWWWEPLIFQTQILWSNLFHSLKYLRSTKLECKGIIKSEFPQKNTFYWDKYCKDEISKTCPPSLGGLPVLPLRLVLFTSKVWPSFPLGFTPSLRGLPSLPLWIALLPSKTSPSSLPGLPFHPLRLALPNLRLAHPPSLGCSGLLLIDVPWLLLYDYSMYLVVMISSSFNGLWLLLSLIK